MTPCICGVIDCNECRTKKRHECANMGKVKWLELWWQLYRTLLPVWDLENFRPMDFCWHECTNVNFIVLHVPVELIFCYVRGWTFIWPVLHLEHVSTGVQWDSLVLCKHVNIQHAIHKYWCLLPWAKATGVCTSAEVKNEWSCTPVPPVGLHRMQRDGFAF